MTKLIKDLRNMDKKALCLIVLLSVFPAIPNAEEKGLVDHLAEAKQQLQDETILNEALKTKLAAREEEVPGLRERIKELEEEIKKLEEKSAELERGGV